MAGRPGHTPSEIPVQIPPPQYLAVSSLGGGGVPSLGPIRLSWQFPLTAKYTGKIALTEPAQVRRPQRKPRPVRLLQYLTSSLRSKEQGINRESIRRSRIHSSRPIGAL